LLLIDEASQVNPVDALGAIARARQIVVVGDDKQLPPTNFFNKVLADSEDDHEDENFSPSDVESILGLCSAQGMPSRMLRWHYRSKHESLIAVSNREFYSNRLYIVPSAAKSSTELGLFFRHVPEGVFDRGGSTTNRIEAAAVARAVMDHARHSPKQTLGVGAFSVAQRDAILDELEQLRRHENACEEFFAPGNPDPFFIKNLENIQGDERDVIFISVGYARDKDGYLAMSFGPLQFDGGERRLNVLISRARERCEVFSSITADDIDLARARSRGAHSLKTFLAFAQSGVLDIGVATGRDFGSDFEEEVARALSAYGLQIIPQVGIAGFFVDLAVVDPDQPGRYLLGIECDGRAYHSSRSARDRDRLRENVLRSRGWIIHRIWSTDWFHRPQEQIRKALDAVDRAKAEWSRRGDQTTVAEPTRPTASIDRVAAEATPSGNGSPLAVPYQEAVLVAGNQSVADMPGSTLLKLVLQILQVEGPIHREELTRRAVDLTGGKRVTKRLQAAVDSALIAGRRNRSIANSGDFYVLAGQTDCPIRDRSDVVSQGLRKAEMIAPSEIRAAVVAVVKAHYGAAAGEVVTAVSRILGFGTTTPQLRAAIEAQLADDHQIECRDGKLYARN
jgi:very-short-patch-repair endonuclease